MTTVSVLELLYYHRLDHILQQIFLLLDSKTIKSLTLVSRDMRAFVRKMLWKNVRAKRILKNRLKKSWLTRDGIAEAAFQCSDDAFDLKIRGGSIICGLRNGTVEVWNETTLQKEFSLEEQQGSVQVDANDNVVVGVSSDSTVCVWDRRTGQCRDVFYHHRASVWGVRIQSNKIVTGSMDGTISVIDVPTLKVEKHFMAHEDEWGVSDIDCTDDFIISGCFGRILRIWSFPSCEMVRSIQTGHAINCVSIHKDVAVTCSRTGRGSGAGNVQMWDVREGKLLKTLDVPSACYVKLDSDKLVALVSAGEGIIGEHHMIKWPIAKILTILRPKDIRSKEWDRPEMRSEILLRYRQTPAVTANETTVVFTQSRTRGMCSLLNFWPT